MRARDEPGLESSSNRGEDQGAVLDRIVGGTDSQTDWWVGKTHKHNGRWYRFPNRLVGGRDSQTDW